MNKNLTFFIKHTKPVKIKVILISLLALSLFFALGGIFNATNTSETGPVINAVPVDAGIIFRTENFDKLISILQKTSNPVWEELKSFSSVKKLDSYIAFLDSIGTENPKIKSFFSDRQIMVSSHITGRETVDFLFLMKLNSNTEAKLAAQIFNEYLSGRAAVVEKSYSNTSVYEVSIFNNTTPGSFSYSITGGLLMVSKSTILLEDAIRQMGSISILRASKGLDKVFGTAGKNVHGNLFVNYKIFPKQFTGVLNTKYKNYLGTYNRFSGWAALDLGIKLKGLGLSGFTYSQKGSNDYLNVFEGQAPQTTKVHEVLPSNTATFMTLGFDNFSVFMQKNNRFIQQNNGHTRYNNALKKYTKKMGVDFETQFSAIVANEACVAFTSINKLDIGQNTYVLFKMQSNEMARGTMVKIIETYAKSKKKTLLNFTKQYKLDNETEFSIYQMPYSNVIKYMFGKAMAHSDPNYFTFVNGYLVFGSSYNSLASLLRSNVHGKTLSNSSSFTEFSELLSDKSNLFVFSNAASSLNFYNQYLKAANRNMLMVNAPAVRKFQSNAIQFSNSKGMMFTNIVVDYNPVLKKEPLASWATKLDTITTFKPRIMRNHRTQTKDVFVQDEHNRIYLINKEGRIMWSKLIEEPIISDVYQVDYFKNNKLQMLFSTKNKIYLIDLLGNYVSNYPIQLPYPATAGISIFDYEKNKKYRIFVPVSNKKVYAFDIKGKIIEGWKFSGTESNVSHPVQYFSVKGRDYIIFSDKKNTYVVNRKGKQRIKVQETIDRAQNSPFYLENGSVKESARWVTSGSDGSIYELFLNGKVKKTTIGHRSPEHYFLLADIDSDGSNDYIYADLKVVQVYNKKKKLLFSKNLNNTIQETPVVYRFSKKSRKLGIATGKSGKIHLFNADGTEHDGFPLNGIGMYSITMLNPQANGFNLLVGTADSFLYNYNVDF